MRGTGRAIGWRLLAAAAAALAAGLAAAATAEPGDDAKRFGAREQVRQVALSPDGTRFLAVMAAAGRTSAVVVGSAVEDKPVRVILSSNGGTEQLGGCHWASDRRIVCSVYLIAKTGEGRLGFTRMVSLAPEGHDLKLLSSRDSQEALGYRQDGGDVIDWIGDPGDEAGGTILMTRQFVPEYSTGTHTAETRRGLGVERVDPVTLRRTLVEAPRDEASEYVTDGHGTVRVAGMKSRSGDYDSGTTNYVYRKRDARGWSPLSTVKSGAQSESGFNPYAIDRDLDVAYGFDRLDGRRALFKVALDGSNKRELVYARPDVDVTGLVRIGRQRRVVGVSYVTDRRQVDFFDPQLKRLSAALSKALPGLPLARFVDASADESKLIVFVGSDVDPGRYAVYDKKTHHLDTLLTARPELADVALAPVKAITYPAADGTPIPAYLTMPVGAAAGTGKGLPAIVMPHGGPGDRDEWGFDWLAQFFARRGFVVLQPNFRGSTGYGEAWQNKNGFIGWRTSIGDVNDAGRWLLAQGIAAPEHLGIVGWSYGGYAALQSAVLDPSLFKAIVAVAPVTDMETLRAEHQNFTSYRLVDAFIGRGDHVRAGSPAQNAGRIKAPVLMFHGTEDQNVGIGESRLMAAKLRAVGAHPTLVEFKGLDHQLDDSAARASMLDQADGFLRASMGMARS